MEKKLFLGKSTESLVLSLLLKENREAYLPAVDDHGVDLIVRTRTCAASSDAPSGAAPAAPAYEFGSAGERDACLAAEFQEIQVKSLSSGGLFAAMDIRNPRPNYWFVFYLCDTGTFWLINSMDVVRLASRNLDQAKNAGKYSLQLAYRSKPRPCFDRYVASGFSRLP